MAKAVFLDRDGTLNVDPGYLSNPDQMNLIPGVGSALHQLQAAGFLLIVVTNQSGVGRGLFSIEQLDKIHGRLNELLRPFHAQIDHFLFCPHRPDESCACRKPSSLLIDQISERYQIDPHFSYMVGDKEIDLLAGIAAKLKGVALVRTGEGRISEGLLKVAQPNFIGDDLLAVANWILHEETLRS